MSVCRENSLINRLFENIVIFESGGSAAYRGSCISEYLSTLALSPESLLSANVTKDDSQMVFADLLAVIMSSGSSSVFNISGSERQFVLFASGDSCILGFFDEIDYLAGIETRLEDSLKEIQCLYNVTKELQFSPAFPEALNKCIPHIKQGFSYPEETAISISIKNKRYGDAAIVTSSVLLQEILLNGEWIGEISVSLLNDKFFLKEEMNLLREIAGKISNAIEKDEKQKNLEKQRQILLAKNEALRKMTEDCNRNRQKLRTFFSAITESIIVLDSDFNITMSNKEEMGDTGKCYTKLFNRETRCENCPAITVFKKGESLTVEREEKEKFLRLTGYPIPDSTGSVDRVLEVCEDITTQKKMEAQLLQSYKLASLGKLVAGVAHEINNPNTFILGNLKIVQESLRDIIPVLDKFYESNPDLKIARLGYETFRKNIPVLVDDMIGGANRTKKIVSDLRNFAKKDEGVLTEDVDLNYIIENNLSLPAKQIKKHAVLRTDLGENLPVFKGSVNRIEQVMMNLIMNASEAIETNEGEINIFTRFDPSPGEVVLTVSDNGCGIPESDLKNIFDPFYTTKRSRGGTGLGLSITYGIIKDHGGSIEAESKPGRGTKFIIRFPVTIKNQSAQDN